MKINPELAGILTGVGLFILLVIGGCFFSSESIDLKDLRHYEFEKQMHSPVTIKQVLPTSNGLYFDCDTKAGWHSVYRLHYMPRPEVAEDANPVPRVGEQWTLGINKVGEIVLEEQVREDN